MSMQSPYVRAMAVPAIGATAITLTLFAAPSLGVGAAAAIGAAGVFVAVRDARAWKAIGRSPVPAYVGGAVSVLIAAGGFLAVMVVLGGTK